MENTEEEYPDKMLRGISSFDFIQDGIITDLNSAEENSQSNYYI